MKNILCNIFEILFALLSVAGGAVLFVCSFPDDLVWNFAGGVLILAGVAAVVSKAAEGVKERKVKGKTV